MNTFLKYGKLLNRKKTDPTKFIFTGEESSENVSVQLFNYNIQNCVEELDFSDLNVLDTFDKDDTYFHWLNIHGLGNVELVVEICRRLGVHNLVTQDILDVNQRPKFLEFEQFSFFTMKSVVPSDGEIEVEQISFVVGKNFLVSFQEKKADYFNHLRIRLRENTGLLRSKGPDFLLFTMLEAILDNYFKSLCFLEQTVAQLQQEVVASDASPEVVRSIEMVRKKVVVIHKTVRPIKDFTLSVERQGLSFIETQHSKYFSEIKDLCLTLIDNTDTLLADLESSTNLFFSLQGHRLNQVMKTLTVVSTIFIPLTFIAGIYGMNFTYMPELQWTYGYAAVWGLIFVIFIGMMIYLRKKGWF